MFCGEGCGTVDVRNIWIAEANFHFVIQCVSRLSALIGYAASVEVSPHS